MNEVSRQAASQSLFAEAAECMPGGVNSPVRSFGAVGGTPPFIERAEGCRLIDADGNEYLDFVGSWGPMVAGHAHPAVAKAVHAAVDRGLSYGAPTRGETELARQLCRRVPSVELVRLVNSGTEAVMSAVRLARAATRRARIIKFAGCYHGHADTLLVAAGSGVLTHGLPDAAGIMEGISKEVLALPYNDRAALAEAFEREGAEIACALIEPVAGNMNFIAADPDFLADLARLCRRHGALLIFDEVMSGFRVASGGAQELYGIKADLTTLGKIIGGGMPLAAYGGRRDLMEQIAPLGPVYQAGTLSGNPVAVAAGLEMLKLTEEPGFYDRLERLSAQWIEGLTAAAAKHGHALSGDWRGGMFGFFFSGKRPLNLEQVQAADGGKFKKFFHSMLACGIYLAPSPFEAGFVSSAHTSEDIDHALAVADKALSSL